MTEDATTHADHLTAMTDAWTRLTGSFFKSAMAANTAAFSVFDVSPDGDRSTEADETLPPEVPSVAYEEFDWTFERTADTRAELGVGDVVRFSKLLEEEDVQAFARASGDTNRLHLDDEFAANTRFGGRIAHGTLVSGLISAALARLPGLTIYLSQDLEFRRPVRIGDRISAVVEVVENLGNDQYRLTTTIRDEDKDETLIDGEAVVLIDDVEYD